MTRTIRQFTLILAFLCATRAIPAHAQTAPAPATVERWGTFETSLKGPTDGNPFDVPLSATFTKGETKLTVKGFYDGEGTYRVRFMPPDLGEWHYVTTSTAADLNAKSGQFTCEKPSESNHGPVHVARTFHFDYADNTPYFQIGTTCYAWTHEPDAQEETTLASLKTAPFNKVRMCVFQTRFPSHRQLYAYESTPAAAGAPSPGRGGVAMPRWDFTRFNVEFFQHFEKRIGDLRALNIQADVILFHPYETGTGFSGQNLAGDQRYLNYIVARLGSYRNVWWSMANEYDSVRSKNEERWDQIGQTISTADIYHHLLSIHNQNRIYNNTQPWITHASIQNGSAVEDFGRANLYRDVYAKPVVFDEVNYEGNIADRWGQLTGEQMTENFWHGTIDGTYVGHGETFRGDQANWISNGGKLEGTSPPRLAFLRKIMESGPASGIDPIDKWRDVHTAGVAGSYYLIYLGKEKPTEWAFEIPARGVRVGQQFKVDVLDTWNMTITPVENAFTLAAGPTKYRFIAQGNAKVTLPGKPYMALRLNVVR